MLACFGLQSHPRDVCSASGVGLFLICASLFDLAKQEAQWMLAQSNAFGIFFLIIIILEELQNCLKQSLIWSVGKIVHNLGNGRKRWFLSHAWAVFQLLLSISIVPWPCCFMWDLDGSWAWDFLQNLSSCQRKKPFHASWSVCFLCELCLITLLWPIGISAVFLWFVLLFVLYLTVFVLYLMSQWDYFNCQLSPKCQKSNCN